MVVSTILLTSDNFYINEDGSLPMRPDFDKTLLTALAKNNIVSNEGYNMLPPSIKSVVKTSNEQQEPEFPITIREINAFTDLLIIVRSNELIIGGKQFRLDNFELLVKDRKIELWRRK